jgi:hypothetical protein
MPICRPLTAIALAVSLTGNASLADPLMLGIVTQAKDANLSTGPVSPGTTVYDGDRVSTDANGALTIRGIAAMFYLAHQSRMILRGMPDSPRSTQAQLSAGTLVFSQSRIAALEVLVDGARIRAAADKPTVGQVTVVGPKTLVISARQSSLLFSYRDDSEVIQEGQSYRVLLDPTDDDSTNKPSDPQPTPPNRRRRGFLLILLALGAAIGTMVQQSANIESPDHP